MRNSLEIRLTILAVTMTALSGFRPTIRNPNGDGHVATQPSGDAILFRPSAL